MAAELIQGGASAHATGINGWAPRHTAAGRGQAEKAQLLLDAGSAVNQRKEIDGFETPLMEAAFAGQPSTIHLLLANDAAPLMRDADGHTPLDIAKNAFRGPDPDVVCHLQDINAQVARDTLLDDLDLPADQSESMKQAVRDTHMAQCCSDSSNDLIETGEHAEAIRILSEHQPTMATRATFVEARRQSRTSA